VHEQKIANDMKSHMKNILNTLHRILATQKTKVKG